MSSDGFNELPPTPVLKALVVVGVNECLVLDIG